MAALGDLIREKILWIVVALSLGAGLMAAYGRERHDGRRPDRSWWTTRAYILPFLGIFTGWCVSRFNLTNNDAAILSAVLALLGYEALRIISDRSRQAAEALADRASAAIGGVGEARPFHSVVDTDDKGRPAAHIEVSDPAKPRRSAIGGALKETYAPPPEDAMPPEIKGLLDKLDPDNPDKL